MFAYGGGYRALFPVKANLVRRHFQISYNPYFLLPFLMWVLGGGMLLLMFDKIHLFAMINGRHTTWADPLMFCATYMGQAEVIVPVLLLLMLIPTYRNFWYLTTATLCNVLPLLLQQSLKSYFDMPRPLGFFHSAPWIHVLPYWPQYYSRSFPSGHSQGAFSFFCFMALLLPRRYAWVGGVFFMLGITVCYSRVYLAAHFFADIYTGSILGMVLTTTIFSVMYHYKKLFFKNSDTFTPAG